MNTNSTSAAPSLSSQEELSSPSESSLATRALMVLLTGLVLGLAGRWLIAIPLGLGVFLWSVSLVLSLFLLAKHQGVLLKGEGRFFAIPAFLFSGMLLWRDMPALATLNFLATLLSLALMFALSRRGKLFSAYLSDYVAALFRAGVGAIIGLPRVLLGDIRWQGGSRQGGLRVGLGVVRGILLALPLLLLFGALFSAADPLFDKQVASWFRLWIQDFVPTVVITIFFTWLVVGALRIALLGDERDDKKRGVIYRSGLSLGGLEIRIILISLNLLFLLFVLFQFRYLFGGHGLVESTLSMSYAEYARSGFFELVMVAALVLPLLLLLDALHGEAGEKAESAQRYFAILAVTLIGLLMIVVLSALQRMRLYQEAYGLTEDRLFSTFFMLWIAVSALWLGGTVLRGRRERFAGGSLLAAFLFLLGMNLLNPDALIARTNLGLNVEKRELDVNYLSRRSADSLPVLYDASRNPDRYGLSLATTCALATSVEQKRSEVKDEERKIMQSRGTPAWASWNWSRSQAKNLDLIPEHCKS